MQSSNQHTTKYTKREILVVVYFMIVYAWYDYSKQTRGL